VEWFDSVESFIDAQGWANIATAVSVAGRYRFQDPCTGEPSSGYVHRNGPGLVWEEGTRGIRVTWGQEPLRPGYVAQVEVRRPGKEEFQPWLVDAKTTEDLFLPDSGSGPYTFRSRATSLAGELLSDWSASAAIEVPQRSHRPQRSSISRRQTWKLASRRISQTCPCSSRSTSLVGSWRRPPS